MADSEGFILNAAGANEHVSDNPEFVSDIPTGRRELAPSDSDDVAAGADREHVVEGTGDLEDTLEAGGAGKEHV